MAQLLSQSCKKDWVRAEADTSAACGAQRKPAKVKRELKQHSPEAADLKDEPGDFIETNCHWKQCGLEFPTQDLLVKVCWAITYQQIIMHLHQSPVSNGFFKLLSW